MRVAAVLVTVPVPLFGRTNYGKGKGMSVGMRVKLRVIIISELDYIGTYAGENNP